VRPPDGKNIRRWYEQFRESSGVKKHPTGWPRKSDEDVNHVTWAWSQQQHSNSSSSNTFPKSFIRKRYYILFLIPVFIAQVTKLVQFTWYNTFSKIPPSTSVHFAIRVKTWRVTRLYSVQCSVLYSETALSRKPFRIVRMYIYTFLTRMADTMTSQNNFSSWDTLYMVIHVNCYTVLYSLWRLYVWKVYYLKQFCIFFLI
jgi:hypothetical protein